MSITVTQQNGVHVVRIVNTEITPLAVDQLFYLLAPVERKVVCIEDSAVISNPPEVTAALNNHTDDTVRIVTKKKPTWFSISAIFSCHNCRGFVPLTQNPSSQNLTLRHSSTDPRRLHQSLVF